MESSDLIVLMGSGDGVLRLLLGVRRRGGVPALALVLVSFLPPAGVPKLGFGLDELLIILTSLPRP